MRLISYEVPSRIGRLRRIGALRDGDRQVVDLNLAYRSLALARGASRPVEEADFFVPPDMLSFLEGGPESMAAARAALAAVDEVEHPDGLLVLLDRDQISLLAPVPRPRTIRDYSLYEGHGSAARNGAPPPAGWYRRPMADKLMPSAVNGPGAEVTWPYHTDKLDIEAELGFYVGKQGTDLGLEEAAGHIAGWTIFLDPNARDASRFAGGFKWKNFQYIMGPCLVTPDEFDERTARVRIRVNGETWFEGTTGDGRQFWSPAALAYSSDNETVYPGEFIGLGAISTSASIDSGRWVSPGDTYEVQVEGVGVISTRIGQRGERVVGWAAEGMAPRTPIPEAAR
jgi:2-keto-4-pentenoate hydratase/2-oxohepta-3-ene-1,7-dioic acid hydratase in catechol pathway